MLLSDLASILQWWTALFFIGIIFIPITNLIFPIFFDKGYIFSKIIGIAFISYCVFILGFLKILPFETQNIFLTVGIFILINLFVLKKVPLSNIKLKSMLPIFVLEELVFISILLFWSFIRAHQPEIHGLEKYMDYGFINSILRADYFPPKDMWFTPLPINYYYFGHLVTAVLTKLSFLPSSITFNLMLSAISALSFVSAFSIGLNLLFKLYTPARHRFAEAIAGGKRYILYAICGGLLTAFIVNFAGNLHTIYLFFKPYVNENPVPFWNLIFSPQTYPNSYWYPNATRFIHNTIHEFPIYSSVVSDLHGHFLDLPFVLLTIAVLLSLIFNFQFSIFNQIKNFKNSNSLQISNFKFQIIFISFLLAVMYMTNAWDGIIYFILTVFVLLVLAAKPIFAQNLNESIKYKVLSIKYLFPSIPHTLYSILAIGVSFIIFTLPFNLNFKPFASGIGILCAPDFLTNLGKFGPFIFESNHCQHSPIWQLGILYGFFYFWIILFILFLKLNAKRYTLNASDIFVGILIILSTLLIIIPEFIYVKDIYPAHYRANTMFKLVYQSFIMLSLSSGYIIIRLISNRKLVVCIFIGSIGLFLVMAYPYFAIKSYFGDLKIYSGLNGTNYLKPIYPQDHDAILWINKNIKGQPVILEAQGDSYTDYGRVSTNTGLPTVLGWTVHEWLWRGTYDIPSPRIEEVKKMYELEDIEKTKTLLKKYNVSLVFVGDLEKQKYSNLNEEKFQSLGKIIFQKGDTKIFKIQ